jgi:hypothetical protein
MGGAGSRGRKKFGRWKPQLYTAGRRGSQPQLALYFRPYKNVRSGFTVFTRA